MRIFFNSLGIIFLSFLTFFLLRNDWWQAIICFLVAAYSFSMAAKQPVH